MEQAYAEATNNPQNFSGITRKVYFSFTQIRLAMPEEEPLMQ